MELKEKIRLLRKDLHLTLEDVAKIVGVGKSTVRKWETGEIDNMKLDKIALLAKALKTSPAYLMGWEENPASHMDEKSLSPSDPNEKHLIELYQRLSPEGKEKIIEYATDLVSSGRYKKPSQSELVQKKA